MTFICTAYVGERDSRESLAHLASRGEISASGTRCDDSAAVSNANEHTVTARARSYFRGPRRGIRKAHPDCISFLRAFLGTYSLITRVGIYTVHEYIRVQAVAGRQRDSILSRP